MIRPHPEAVIDGSARRVAQNAELRIQSDASVHASSERSATRAKRLEPPALLTRMSTEPYVATAASISASVSALLRASARWKVTAGPPLISSSALAPFSALVPLMTTLAPAPTNASAIPRPIPRLPPVTTAVFPSSSAIPMPVTILVAPNMEVPMARFSTCCVTASRHTIPIDGGYVAPLTQLRSAPWQERWTGSRSSRPDCWCRARRPRRRSASGAPMSSRSSSPGSATRPGGCQCNEVTPVAPTSRRATAASAASRWTCAGPKAARSSCGWPRGPTS